MGVVKIEHPKRVLGAATQGRKAISTFTMVQIYINPLKTFPRKTRSAVPSPVPMLVIRRHALENFTDSGGSLGQHTCTDACYTQRVQDGGTWKDFFLL